MHETAARLYGVMGEFAEADGLKQAAQRSYDAGFRCIDAFSPFPVEGLAGAIGFQRTRLPWIVFAGGVVGALGGFALQYYASAIDYPLNVGGRPLASWPAFGVVAFELCILVAALSCVLGMLALNGLPMPHHPVFNVPEFELASQHRFFLLIEANDANFDHAAVREFFRKAGAERVHDVEY